MILRRFAPAPPVEVVADRDADVPQRLCWHGRAHRVTLVEEASEATHGWWDGEPEAIRHRHYRLRLADGTLCLVYRDPDSGRWYLAGIYD